MGKQKVIPAPAPAAAAPAASAPSAATAEMGTCASTTPMANSTRPAAPITGVDSKLLSAGLFVLAFDD